jgi:hypothetical protein
VTWHQFQYHFDGEVERAMRYSIHEAMRRQCRQAGGGTSEGIAEDAIQTFKRKMEKHAPATTDASTKDESSHGNGGSLK